MAEPAKTNDQRLAVDIAIEPSISAPSTFTTVEQVSSVITGLYSGNISRAATLWEQMWQNPRLRAAFSTRLMGLTGAEVRWLPGQENRDGRKAAKAAGEDDRKVMSVATRKQFHKWGIGLGVGFAQKAWYVDTTGRLIPRIKVYHPGAVRWNDSESVYDIRTDGGDVLQVTSPTMETAETDRDAWVVHEPFGSYSWREGYIVSAWYPWLGNNLARRDGLRTAEKMGRGISKVRIPHGASKIAAQELVTGIRGMGAGSVLPLEQLEDGREFQVEPLEWNSSNGYQLIDSIFASTAVDLVILALGHNQTTEVKEGGSYASANVGNDVRSDYIDDDGQTEWDTLYWQVWRDWADANFGDPNLAPRRQVITDPPSRDKEAATMTSLLAQSVENLAKVGVDVPLLLDAYRIPMLVAGKASASVPATPSAPAQGNVDQSHETAAEEMADATESTVEAGDGNDPQAVNGDTVETVDTKATLQLTATDLASVVKVDEARESIGLDPEGGEVGARWVMEHSAIIKADLPVAPSMEPNPNPAPEGQP